MINLIVNWLSIANFNRMSLYEYAQRMFMNF